MLKTRFITLTGLPYSTQWHLKAFALHQHRGQKNYKVRITFSACFNVTRSDKLTFPTEDSAEHRCTFTKERRFDWELATARVERHESAPVCFSYLVAFSQHVRHYMKPAVFHH